MAIDDVVGWLLDSDPALRWHPGRVWFEVDADPGQRSKWLTHSATRVLEWWDASGAGR
jgi:hypothetical protein